MHRSRSRLWLFPCFSLLFRFLVSKASTTALYFPIQLPKTLRCRFLFISILSQSIKTLSSPPFLHNAKLLYHSRNRLRQRQPLGCLAAPCICYRTSYRYSLYNYSCSSICFKCVSAGVLFRLGDVEILSPPTKEERPTAKLQCHAAPTA